MCQFLSRLARNVTWFLFINSSVETLGSATDMKEEHIFEYKTTTNC